MQDQLRPATAVLAPVAQGTRRRVDRWFYISVALLNILFNVLAFGPAILDSSVRNAPLPLTPLVTAHAIVAVAVLLVFLMQATLVATGRTAVHRSMGFVGALLAAVFVVLSYVTVIEEARRGFDLAGLNQPGTPQAFIAAVVGANILPFAILVGAAVFYRRRPDVHKRLMLLAMVGVLTNTPVAHVIGYWNALQPWAVPVFVVSSFVFLSLGGVYDRVSQGRIHPVSLWGGILVFVWQNGFFAVIAPSAAWRDVTAWLIR